MSCGVASQIVSCVSTRTVITDSCVTISPYTLTGSHAWPVAAHVERVDSPCMVCGRSTRTMSASSQPEPCKVCGQSTGTKTESPMSRTDQTRPAAMFRHVLSRQDSALRSMNENHHGCVCPTQPTVPYRRRARSPHWRVSLLQHQ